MLNVLFYARLSIRWAIGVLMTGGLLALLTPMTAHADNQALIQKVQQFLYEQTQTLGEDVMIELRPPSPHLPACIDPEPFLPNTDQSPLGRVNVGVRCGETQRQVRYLQAQVDVIGGYAVATQDIPRGVTITAAMIGLQQGNLSDLSARAITDPQAIIGKVARQPIRRGSTLQPHDIRAPLLVERGQRVSVIAQGDEFRVSREGEAMDNGAEGERVRVRFGSRDILEARVIADGLLMIDF